MNEIIKKIERALRDSLEILKDFLKEYKEKYRVIGCVAVVLVVLKFLIFYNLMSVKSNFIIICLVSLLITYYLFTSFRNKYIPAIIYLILSFLMFADVTYCSFFNKYLSVSMIGSAGMLGDITASIKEVMKPINFFMMVDSVVIIATIIMADFRNGREKGGFFKSFFLKEKETEEVEPVIKFIEVKTENSEGTRDILAEFDAMEAEENRVAEGMLTANQESDGMQTDTETEGVEEEPEPREDKPDILAILEGMDAKEEGDSRLRGGRAIRKRKERKKKKEKIRKLYVYRSRVIPICIIALLIITGGISPFMQSVSKQEFFTYHVGDLVTESFGLTGNQQIMEFTDHYEAEKNGPLFGIGEGKNLVVIQIESFQDFLIGLEYDGQEVTPFLNSLIEDKSVYFDQYYQQVGTGNTSDAEFATNNSILGSIEAFTYQLYENNYFRGLPWLLSDKGYYTAVLHAHENRAFWNRDDIYTQLGFDDYFGGLIGDEARPGGNFEMTEWMGWGLTDTEFYPQAMEFIKEFKEPFYSFIITLSNHHPYEMLDKYNFIDLKDEDKGTLAGNYLNSAAYTDYALSQMFEAFKDEGLYENTVFALYGDHMGLSAEEETNQVMKRILGHEYDWDDRMNIPLIIHVPSASDNITETIHNPGGQVDFLPTISYIMGLEHLDTIYLGHNLFTYEDSVVAQHAYLPYGSFFIDGYGFEMSRDGVFKNGRAWDLKTRESAELDQLYDAYQRAMSISDTSVYILKNDVLRKVYEEGKSREEVL